MRPDKNKALKEKCKGYIRRTTTFPQAKELAQQEGFSANFSVWISAFAEMIGKKGGLS
jgi:hypothetical protein